MIWASRPQKSSQALSIRRACLAFFILIFFNTTHVFASQPRAERPRVLLLHAYNFTFPATTIVSNAARNRLIELRAGAVDIDADFLDLARRPDDAHALSTANFLREKYNGVHFDIILAVGIAAADFSAKYRNIFAPDVPVVFGGGTRRHVNAIRFPPNVTGIVSDVSVGKILDLAERLQPDARRLIVIGGSGILDRPWQTLAKNELKEREAKFETSYWFDFDYNTLLGEIAQLPSNSIVIALTAYADRNGKPLIPRDVAAAISKASRAPVYGPFETYLGNAIVGGYIETYESLGNALGNLAARVLSGTDPKAVPIASNVGQHFIVDANAMKHWGLRQSDLPVGTKVLFQESSIWQTHRELVIVTGSALGLQSLLLAGLLLQRRRRQKAESLLRKSEERMGFAATAANIGLWQFDSETGKVWTTEHCRELLGIATDKPIDRDTIINAVHTDDRNFVVDEFKKAAISGTTFDFRVLHRNGQQHWIRARARALFEDDASARVSGIFVDITEQKAAEAEADEQRQEVAHLTRVSMMGELSGAIAHEINQPLTAILSNAQAALQLMRHRSPDLVEITAAIQDIVGENNRASEVIQRMRRFLKKGEHRYETVEVNDLIRSTVSLLNSEALARRARLEFNQTLIPFLVEGDPIQLQQVLLNLVLNAMDAMTDTPAAQRIVTLATRSSSPDRVEVIVEDRGCGLDQSDLERIFEPFYTTKDHGLGLGLSICSTIVRSHGGQLILASSAQGGTIARFTLPISALQVAAQ